MADSRLRIILSVQDRASGALRGVQSRLGGFRGAVSKAGDMLRGMAAGLAAGGTAVAVFKKAIDFAEEGAAFQRLEVAADTLASKYGQTSEAIIAAMDQAAGGTLSRSQTMLAANQALLLGVARTPEQFDKLTTASIALGRAMGLDAQRAIESVTVGVGRQSKLWLDNLGVIFDAQDAYEEYAASIGKDADELTDFEKKQAFVNEVLKAAEPLLDSAGNAAADTGSKYERLTAFIEDQQTSIKVWLGEGLAPWVDLLTGFGGALDQHNTKVALTADTYEDYVEEMERANEASGPFIKDVEILERGQWALARANESSAVTTDLVRDSWMKVPEVADIVAPKIMEVFDSVQRTRIEFSNLQTASDVVWTSMQTGIEGSIRSLISNIEFLAGGGAEIVAAFENVKQAIEDGIIPPEDAIPALESLELAAIGVQEKIGLIDMEDATNQVKEEFNVSLEEAEELINNAKGAIDEIPDTITKTLLIQIQMEQAGVPIDEFPGFLLPGGGFQFGGIVPGPIGSPRLIMAHGGEQVIPHNYNLTINSQADTEDVVGQFNMMKALSGGGS